MTGVRNSIKQQQSSWVCHMHLLYPGCLCLWSHSDLHVIRDDCSIQPCMLKSEDKNMSGAEWDSADILRWNLAMHSGEHWENKQWEKTASREQKWDRGEMRNEAECVLSEGRHMKLRRNVISYSFILHHQIHISHSAGPILPSRLPHPNILSACDSPRVLQTNLYLHTHQGIWHRPADHYLQVERLSNCLLLRDYQRWEKEPTARRWSGTSGGL